MATRKFSLALLALAFVLPLSGWASTATLTPIADTGLDENLAGTPQGSSQTLITGNLSPSHGVARNRGLFRFDPSTNIPAGAIITSAQFTINVYKVADATPYSFDLRKMTVSWGESNATWQVRNTAGDLWGAAGGLEGTDFSATASASLGISSTGLNTFSSTANFVADVQGWLDNPASNFGWMLLPTTEGTPRSARRYFSREGSIYGPNLVPVLVLDYTAVPEPGVNALLALGAAGWIGWRISRHRG